jgi:hypothetical protein
MTAAKFEPLQVNYFTWMMFILLPNGTDALPQMQRHLETFLKTSPLHVSAYVVISRCCISCDAETAVLNRSQFLCGPMFCVLAEPPVMGHCPFVTALFC